MAAVLWTWATDSLAMVIWVAVLALGLAALCIAEVAILEPWERVPQGVAIDDHGLQLLGRRAAYRHVAWADIERATETSPNLLLLPFCGHGCLTLTRVDYRGAPPEHFYVLANLRGYSEVISAIRAHAPAQPGREVRTYNPGRLYRLSVALFASGICVLVAWLIVLAAQGRLGRPPITSGACAAITGAAVAVITLFAISYTRTAFRLTFGPGWIEVKTGVRRSRFQDADLIRLSPRGATSAVLRWRNGSAYIYSPVFDAYCEIIEELNLRLARQR